MPPDLPRISIVTPSFNQGRFLERTLKSVLDQSYPPVEYVVIDGGSGDDSPEILRRYASRLTYWVSERDRGQSHAVNKGLQHVTGDVIGWLNSDDVYAPGAFDRAARYFAEHPEVDVLFGDYAYIDTDDQLLHLRREIPFSLPVYLWTRDCYHANCAGFFRRRCFTDHGGLREDLHLSMDYELYMRWALAGCTFGHLPEILGSMRIHGDAKSVAQVSHQRAEGYHLAQEIRTNLGVGRLRAELLGTCYRSYRLIRKLVTGKYGAFGHVRLALRKLRGKNF